MRQRWFQNLFFPARFSFVFRRGFFDLFHHLARVVMRRACSCKVVLARRMESISVVIRAYSTEDAASSVRYRIMTVAQIPTVATSIIARNIHDGIRRKEPTASGKKSRETSRNGILGST